MITTAICRVFRISTIHEIETAILQALAESPDNTLDGETLWNATKDRCDGRVSLSRFCQALSDMEYKKLWIGADQSHARALKNQHPRYQKYMITPYGRHSDVWLQIIASKQPDFPEWLH